MTTKPGQRQDPFDQVKNKVVTSWSTISSNFHEWQSLSTSGSSADQSKLNKAIKEGLRGVIVDLNDLEQTIKIVEENRSKFTNIDDHELQSRKKFVSDMKLQVKDVKQAITSAKTARQSEQSIHKALMSSRTTRGGMNGDYEHLSSTDRAVNADNEDHIATQKQIQQKIEADQDEVLVDMEHALANLTGMADNMNTQLNEQKAMIDELDENVDDANKTMVMVNRKITKLLGTSDKGRICCILLLFITVIALFIGIIYG